MKVRARISSSACFILLTFLVNCCFLKQDRTTVIYGTITDQNGQPVDSILVLMDGVKGFKYETLKEVYSDGNGNYELVSDVAGKYASVDVGIPSFPLKNPKFEKSYKISKIYKDGHQTANCCSALIGEKTKYDFQLIPR